MSNRLLVSSHVRLSVRSGSCVWCLPAVGCLALSHHHLHLFFVSNIVIYCLSSPSSVWRLWPLNMPKTFPHLQRSIFVSIQFESERFESYRSTKLHMITLDGKTARGTGKGDEVRTAFFPWRKKCLKCITLHNIITLVDWRYRRNYQCFPRQFYKI